MQLSKIDAVRSCQPLKQTVPAVPLRDVAFKNSATYSSSDSFKSSNNNIEAKYDFACRLAAFYKQQYEVLKTEKSCCV